MNFPPTLKRPTIDEYHGVQVADDYRWLEDASDPEVRAWTAAQNALTRSILDATPRRSELHAHIKELYEATSSDYYALSYRGGRLFAMKMQPPKAQPMLVALASADDLSSERVVLDPNRLDPDGTTAIDWFVPSHDGARVAVSLSEKGSEDGTLHVYDVETGRELDDVIPRVQYPTGGGSVAWRADGSGFYYTRYPHAGERLPEDLNFYQQVYFHHLGAPSDRDTYCIGQDFPRIAEVHLEASEDGKFVLAVVANGDGGEFAHYLLLPSGEWRQLTRFEDKVTQAAFEVGDDRALYLKSLDGAPRGKLLRLSLDDESRLSLAHAKTVVEESASAIIGFEPAGNLLYVVGLDGGPADIRVFDHAGREQGALPIPPVSSVGELLRTAGDTILFRSSSFIAPPAWYEFDPQREEPRRTALYVTPPADFNDAEVVRDFATSKDGVRVPVNIIKPKRAKLDGQNPTVLYGYGGYGISLSPVFNIRRRIWLDQGGIFAIANLRGGGEYGDDWHTAGNLTRKQNVFDDFIACAEFLIGAGYTNPDKLAVEGGSNGGLLMGAALTQRPDSFRAVVAHVGIYDMLRVELDPNGAFNVTEFGTVKDAEQFQALYAYSPYHRVVDGVRYPAVLIVTGENDGRVNPYHSRKMTARLQAATTSDRPVLLRTSANSGHGIGTALQERIEQDTDVFAFLCDQLGLGTAQTARAATAPPAALAADPVSLVRRFNDALNARDIDAMMQLMTDDCVFENTSPAPDGARFEGQVEVRAFWEEFFRNSSAAAIDIEDIFAHGDRCVMRWTYRWVDRSGQDGHIRGVDVYRIKNDRISEKLSYVKG
jgi:prolyl oligopeptidase